MKSQRLNLLVTPEEKALIEERARQNGMSASELVRRAVVSFDPAVDMEELRALAQELAGVAERMDQKLTARLVEIEDLRRQLADKDALKAAAIAELEASGRTWPFELPDSCAGNAHGDAT